jgi:ferritin
MLTNEMINALNEHMNKEMYSAYLYMSMSSWCEKQGLKGFANWYMVQYHEEMFHAMKLYGYILRQGGTIKMLSIDEPADQWKSALDIFEKTLEHEQMVTGRINDLMEMAIAGKDHATRIFLQWYVAEQVEEEENDNDIIAQLKLIGDNPQALLMLDRELAQRAATVPLNYSISVEKQASGE